MAGFSLSFPFCFLSPLMESHLFCQKVSALQVTAWNAQRHSSGRPTGSNTQLVNSSIRRGQKKGKHEAVQSVHTWRVVLPQLSVVSTTAHQVGEAECQASLGQKTNEYGGSQKRPLLKWMKRIMFTPFRERSELLGQHSWDCERLIQGRALNCSQCWDQVKPFLGPFFDSPFSSLLSLISWERVSIGICLIWCYIISCGELSAKQCQNIPRSCEHQFFTSILGSNPLAFRLHCYLCLHSTKHKHCELPHTHCCFQPVFHSSHLPYPPFLTVPEPCSLLCHCFSRAAFPLYFTFFTFSGSPPSHCIFPGLFPLHFFSSWCSPGKSSSVLYIIFPAGAGLIR